MEGTKIGSSVPAFEFRCDVKWSEMEAMNAPRDKRLCHQCDQAVHFCRTLREFDHHARHGHCVALFEDGPFAEMAVMEAEIPDPSKPSPPRAPAFPPWPDLVPAVPTEGPRVVRVPTAGVPRMPGSDKPTREA